MTTIMLTTRVFVAAAGVLAVSGFVVHPSPLAKPASPVPELDARNVLTRSGCVDRGREVFFDRKRARCSGCHSIEDDQGLAGPNLWAVGSKLDKRGLLDAILEPSAEIPTQYHVYIFDTETQGLIVGVVSSESDDEIVVHNEAGEVIRLEPRDVFDVRKSNLSMMPEDIVETITEYELIDLLEFLTTLRPETPGA